MHDPLNDVFFLIIKTLQAEVNSLLCTYSLMLKGRFQANIFVGVGWIFLLSVNDETRARE